MTSSSTKEHRLILRTLKDWSVRLIKNSLQLLILIYKTYFRGIFGYACKHHPSCSSYAKQAYEVHAPLYASFLALKRVLFCNPLVSSKYDPVPLGSSCEKK